MLAWPEFNARQQTTTEFTVRIVVVLEGQLKILSGPEKAGSSQIVRHDNRPRGIQDELHIVRIGGTGDMNKGVVEIDVNQALLELLYKVEHSGIEILRRPRVVCKWLLRRNITVQYLFRKDILLIQKQHNRSVCKSPIIANGFEQL